MIKPRSRQFWLSVSNLALPVAGQTFLLSFLGMADVVMVSSLGETAVAAVGLAAKLHFLLLVIMMGIATACSILVAQYYGAGKTGQYRNTLITALVVGLIAMLPFVLAFGQFSDTWVRWINPDQQVVALAGEYLAITALVLIASLIIVVFEGALRAIGDTKLPLVASIIAAVLNVLLNYALIFGHWGFPAMGVAGAAWGTLISRVVQMCVVLGWVYWTSNPFAFRLDDVRAAVKSKSFNRYIQFASPLVINHGAWAAGNATYHIVTGYAGTDALAVMGVIVPVELAFFSIFIGLANASAVLIGHELGRDNTEEAWQLHVFFDRMATALVIVFSISVWLGRSYIVNIFGQTGQETAVLLLHTLTIFCLLMWLKVLNLMRIIGVLRAGGDIRFCLVTDVIVMWVFGIPAYIIAVFVLKLPFLVLFCLIYLEEFLKFFPVWKRVKKRIWIQNLTRDSAHPPPV